MNSDAEKYFVTHDKGYFDKFLESEEAFGKGLRWRAGPSTADDDSRFVRRSGS